MEHFFILNPAAGSKDRTEELKAAIEAVKCKEKVTVYVTKKAGEAEEAARKAVESTADFVRVYACGGDGTANEALRGILGHDNCVLGIVPVGSGNDFVRYFSEYSKEDFLNIEKMMNGTDVYIDIIEGDGKYAMNTVSVGFDCAVAKNMTKFKRLPLVSGSLAYKLSIVYCLFTKRKHNFTILLDGKEFASEKTNTLLTVAGNGTYYGGGIKATPTAEIDDGKIEFLHITTVSVPRFLSLFGKYTKGLHVNNPKLPFVTSKKCEKIKFVSPNPVDIGFDGEIHTIENPEIRIIPSAVRIIVPSVKERVTATK